jgi:hypothetical protein
LIFDPIAVFTFAGLTIAAICCGADGVAQAPAFLRHDNPAGAGIRAAAAIAVSAAFGLGSCLCGHDPVPIVSAWANKRRSGRIHPAWRWGIGRSLCLSFWWNRTYSPVGTAIYDLVTEAPGAATPLEFSPPPPGTLVTGRT